MNLASIQQGIKKLQWFEYLKVVFLEILNAELCRVFANQVTYYELLLIFITDTDLCMYVASLTTVSHTCHSSHMVCTYLMYAAMFVDKLVLHF